MQLELFLSRFHPLIVHLPIGFLILGAFLEILDGLTGEKGSWRRVILWTLGLSLLAGIFAVITGLLLEAEGRHGGATLDRHKIFGIALVVLTALTFLAKLVKQNYSIRWSIASSVILLALLSVTGHLGGELTHGKQYLSEFAPKPLKPLLGGSEESTSNLTDLHRDSILVYQHVILPILEAKCTRCHQTEQARGGLDMSAFSQLLVESETGTPIVPGDPLKSGIFQRVTLDPDERKFMPPSGQTMSYSEIAIMRWWIEQGADSLQKFDSEVMDEEFIAMIQRNYGKDYHPRPYYELVTVEETDQETLNKLNANGFSAQFLGEENYLLDLAFQEPEMAAEHYNLLKEVAPSVTFLDLSEAQIPKEVYGIIERMPHLTRLDLHGTNVSDEDLSMLNGLQNLEVINVYNTNISDSGLEGIKAHGSLQRIYLWKTQTTDRYVAELSSARPDLELVTGFDWN